VKCYKGRFESENKDIVEDIPDETGEIGFNALDYLIMRLDTLIKKIKEPKELCFYKPAKEKLGKDFLSPDQMEIVNRVFSLYFGGVEFAAEFITALEDKLLEIKRHQDKTVWSKSPRIKTTKLLEFITDKRDEFNNPDITIFQILDDLVYKIEDAASTYISSNNLDISTKTFVELAAVKTGKDFFSLFGRGRCPLSFSLTHHLHRLFFPLGKDSFEKKIDIGGR